MKTYFFYIEGYIRSLLFFKMIILNETFHEMNYDLQDYPNPRFLLKLVLFFFGSSHIVLCLVYLLQSRLFLPIFFGQRFF